MGSLFKILIDGANDTFALTKLIVGQTVDAALNGIAAFSFKDFEGKAIMPQLNDEGAIIVSSDAGSAIFSDGIKLVEAGQVKDVEILVGEVDLALDEVYNCFFANVSSSRWYLWRLEWIDGEGTTDTVTEIGRTYTDAGILNSEIDRLKFKVDTNGKAGVQKIRLFATPLDKIEDIYADITFNLLPQ